jgi:hypothetical protein
MTRLRTATLSALVIGGVMAAALPMTANADVGSRDRTFCAAIGLSQGQQAACEQQLYGATDAQQRHDLQAAWVQRSALADRFVGNSLYDPPVDSNILNGMPATVYQSKPGFVSNRTIAAINRALKADNITSPYAF